MNFDVDIRVVTTIATLLVAVTTCIVWLSRQHSEDQFERRCLGWLFGAGLAFGAASAFLLASTRLPFWIGASGVVAGSHLGLVLGYLFVRDLFDMPRRAGIALGLAAGNCLAQTTLSFFAETVLLVVVNSSAVNGLAAACMAVSVARAARPLGRMVTVVVSLPFATIAAAYAARLAILGLWYDPVALTVASAGTSLVMGIACMQWGFGSLAVKALRMNDAIEGTRAEAERLALRRQQFLFHMSHEIRTPLNGIVGMLDLAEMEDNPAAIRDMIRDMKVSGDHLTRILNDLLDHGRIEANGVELEEIPFAVADMALAMERTFGPACGKKGVALSAQVAPGAEGGWRGDPHKISRILYNLVGNAVKFTETGRVDLRFAAAAGGGLEITVADSGIGMTPEQIGHLFDEFVQAEVSILRRYGGTGLGMAITRRLLDAMDGQMVVESESGRGTAFRLRIPLARSDLPPAAVDRVPRCPDPATGALRVLHADDSPTNRKIMEKMLAKLGCGTVSVADGVAAVETAAGGPFDLYLLDISMPKLSGVDALARIRAADRAAGRAPVPAIACTANDTRDDGQSYLAAGFTHHLRKPIKYAQLRAITTQAAGRGVAEAFVSPDALPPRYAVADLPAAPAQPGA